MESGKWESPSETQKAQSLSLRNTTPPAALLEFRTLCYILSEVFRIFFSHKVNARRPVDIPPFHLIIGLTISRQTWLIYLLDKWKLARNPKGADDNATLAYSFFRSQSMASWAIGLANGGVKTDNYLNFLW